MHQKQSTTKMTQKYNINRTTNSRQDQNTTVTTPRISENITELQQK